MSPQNRISQETCHRPQDSSGRASQSGTIWRHWLGHGLSRLTIILTLAFAGANLAPVQAQEIKVLDLITNDLVYDPVSQKIYASVPSAAGTGLGNTITTIDPFTATIETSVFVGSEPGPLAVSDDGQFVYVGLNGAGAIRRYDIATATAGLEIFLGSDSWFGPYYAEDIEVLPGAPHSIAVSRKNLGISPRHAGVAVYDDNAMRPNTTQRHTGSNRIEFSDSATLLYGYNNETTEFGFRQISITPDGATEVALQRDLISGFGVDIEFEQGVVYATSGRAVDPDALALIGTYAASGPVEADGVLGKVFFLQGTSLQTFDIATFVLENSTPIAGMSGTPGSLIRWGDDGLAFRTSGGQVFLISLRTSVPQGPICSVQLDRAVYFSGDTVVATSLRLANPTGETISIEARLWFDRPDAPPFSKTGILPNGPFDLPAGVDQDLGPVALGTVGAALARGDYAFSCRLIDPVTADHLVLDVNPFAVQ